MLVNDNEESREVIEYCYKRLKTVVNPIIDWTDDEVWEFIHEYKIPYCSLYDEGFKRIGCVGCPMAGPKRQERELNRWPVYKQNYLKAFERMLKTRKERGLECEWKTGEEVLKWWLQIEPLDTFTSDIL